MNMQLLAQARQLSVQDQIELVEALWDNIAEETAVPVSLSVEQRAELHRRFAEHQADPASSIPWEQIRTNLLKSAS